eukprot:4393953-Pyramimonas_sp.AAC.1
MDSGSVGRAQAWRFMRSRPGGSHSLRGHGARNPRRGAVGGWWVGDVLLGIDGRRGKNYGAFP